MTNSNVFQKIILPVHGITGESCVTRLESALNTLRGVTDIVIDPNSRSVHLSYNPALVDVTDVWYAIIDAGFSIPTQDTRLQVAGMNCVSCVAHVEGALSELPGVTAVNVNLRLGSADVQFIPEVVTESQIQAALRQAGYAAS